MDNECVLLLILFCLLARDLLLMNEIDYHSPLGSLYGFLMVNTRPLSRCRRRRGESDIALASNEYRLQFSSLNNAMFPYFLLFLLIYFVMN